MLYHCATGDPHKVLVFILIQTPKSSYHVIFQVVVSFEAATTKKTK